MKLVTSLIFVCLSLTILPSCKSTIDWEEKTIILMKRNPINDCDENFKKGNKKFKGILRFGVHIPAVGNSAGSSIVDKYGYEAMEGTSDVMLNDDYYFEYDSTAVLYATAYNQRLLFLLDEPQQPLEEKEANNEPTKKVE